LSEASLRWPCLFSSAVVMAEEERLARYRLCSFISPRSNATT
jgi:hypothetical protein